MEFGITGLDSFIVLGSVEAARAGRAAGAAFGVRAGAGLLLAAALLAERVCGTALARAGAPDFRVAAAFFAGAVFLTALFLAFAFTDGFFAAT